MLAGYCDQGGGRMNNHVLSERELAFQLGLSPWTVRTLRLQNGLPHIRTAGRIFYRLQTVQEWFTEQEKVNTRKVSPEPEQYGKLRRIT